MATTQRPFDYGKTDYLDRLNDLMSGGMPRLRADPNDPASAGVDISADRRLVFNDTGCIGDVIASCSFTFDPSTLADGWGVFIHVVTGTATINVAASGGAYLVGGTSKTITAGNSAYISSNGVGYRILRMVST
jgi:hypothetical protein